MYLLNEDQIDYILNDIKDRGIQMEDLQSNLLDHICCMIEEGLEENGDFKAFYESVITRFYKKDLSEIEAETISLLTFKNYFAMKKTMMFSGTMAAITLTLGLILKFGHLPGAGVMITLGIATLSFIFLPLFAVLKIKERKDIRDRVLLLTGTMSGIALSLGTLFKIMFWPGANVLGLSALLILMFVYLPVYFFTGIRDPEKKLNTIVNSVILLAGCGLFLTLVKTPGSSYRTYLQETKGYLYQEQLLDREKLLTTTVKSTATPLAENTAVMNHLCEELKAFIIRTETGHEKIQDDYEKTGNFLGDTRIDRFIKEDAAINEKLGKLKNAVRDYNEKLLQRAPSAAGPSPIAALVLETNEFRTVEALNSLVQIQLALMQNQRLMVQ